MKFWPQNLECFFDFPCCSVSFRSFHSMIHHKQPHGMFIVTRAHTLDTAERVRGKKKENGASVTASDEVGRGTCQRERCQAPTRSNLVWGRTSCEVKWGNEMTSKFCWSTSAPSGSSSQASELGIEPMGSKERIQWNPSKKKRFFWGTSPDIPTRALSEKRAAMSPSTSQPIPYSKSDDPRWV